MNVQNPEILSDDELTVPQLPALKTEIRAIVDARDAAIAKIIEAAETLENAYALSKEAERLAAKAHMGRKFYGLDRSERGDFKALFRDGFDLEASVETYRQQVDASIWTYLLEHTGMTEMMDVTAARAFEQDLRDGVQPVTMETLRATFADLMGNADLIFARGLATAFSKLDARFKSHDAFKLGSRMILTRVFSEFSGSFSYSGWERETIIDIERVFAKLDGMKANGGMLMQAIEDSRRGGGYGPKQSLTESTYFRIRGFKNGNAHLWFTRDDLVEKANKVLADFCGEVIPDAAPADMDGEAFRSGSNLPAKDLQFYHSPEGVTDRLLSDLYLAEGAHVLEPSAGTGHIVRALLAKKPDVKVTAVELHPDRANQLRKLEGRNVQIVARNFLNEPTFPVYDAVVMNPPFYGTHWMDHIRHAWDFAKDGGKLVAVLPVSASVSDTPRHLAFRRWAERVNGGRTWGMFTDLPPESFAECGTRINTVILTLRK